MQVSMILRKRSVKEKLYDYKAAIDFEENQYTCIYESVMGFLVVD